MTPGGYITEAFERVLEEIDGVKDQIGQLNEKIDQQNEKINIILRSVTRLGNS
jgi:archaellum component FlaC